ncbi:MAG: radical SAM protein [Desulfuromonadales bacterium]|nr:radical SAM protein [Desulfuromonadales bacterium]
MTTTPPLRCFYLYLTSGCNCACRHCWIVADRQGPTGGQFLPVERVRQAIEQALPLGLNSLKWTGGEPTLHPDFPMLLDLQAEYRLAGRVETNGILLTAGLARQMRATGVESVSVSLDGARAATHEAIRGVTGCFDKTVRGIEHLVAAGYRPELIFSLQRGNRAELPELIRLAERLGAGRIKINLVQPLLQGKELTRQGETLTVAEVLDLAAALAADNVERTALPVELDLPPAFRPLSRFVAGEGGVCDILHILGILPRGVYALCGIGEHVAELALGEIHQNALARIWSTHPVLVSLREGLPTKLQGVCADCLLRAACRGNCVAANFQLGRNLFAPFWFCASALEQGLFPPSRLRR